MFHCKCPFYKTKTIKFEHCVTFEMKMFNNYHKQNIKFMMHKSISHLQAQNEKKQSSTNEFKNRSEEIQAKASSGSRCIQYFIVSVGSFHVFHRKEMTSSYL